MSTATLHRRHDERSHDRMAGAPMEGTGVTGEESREEIDIWQVGTDEAACPGLPDLGYFRWNEGKSDGTSCQCMTNR